MKLPEVPRHEHYVPAAEQVHALAATIAERYPAVVYLAAGCGLRGAEITGPEVESLDFLSREVDVTQQLVCITGREPYLGPPKTKTSARTVELPAITAAALARHIEMFSPVEVEIWDRTSLDRRKHHRRTARLVFTTIADALDCGHRAGGCALCVPSGTVRRQHRR